MSSYKVLSRVNHRLRAILWSAFEADPEIRAIITSPDAITFSPPDEASRNEANRLSLWLYQVTETGFRSTLPVDRGQASPLPPPLTLELRYMVTPVMSAETGGDANNLLLGKVMQVLHAMSVLLLEEEEFDTVEKIQLVLEPLSLEELSRLWEALRTPYRLSLCYRLKVVRIDSPEQSSSRKLAKMEVTDDPVSD